MSTTTASRRTLLLGAATMSAGALMSGARQPAARPDAIGGISSTPPDPDRSSTPTGIATSVDATGQPRSTTEAATANNQTAPIEPVTFVLVHGAWHRPEPTWHLVEPLLHAAGHQTVAVALPSAGPAGPDRPGLTEDVAAVTSALEQLDGPAVLVGHSYGGVVVSTAGHHPRVRSLVYLAAFALDEGQTVLDIAATVTPPPLIAAAIDFRNDGLMTIRRSLAKRVFYADVPRPLANTSVDALVPSTAEIFSTPQPTPAWQDKPSTYVVCSDDRAIPVSREREMARHCTNTIELASSHSAFLSMPKQVTELLTEHVRTIG